MRDAAAVLEPDYLLQIRRLRKLLSESGTAVRELAKWKRTRQHSKFIDYLLVDRDFLSWGIG